MTTRDHEEDQTIQRNKGSFTTGKILKGTMSSASLKTKVASIPNRHQNIIYATNTSKGFGTSLHRDIRASTQHMAYPGPGFYDVNLPKGKTQSKKGTGFFGSKTKLTTLQRSKSFVPGPGSYITTQIEKQGIKSQQNQPKISSSVDNRIQAHQLFKSQLKNSLQKPAVGSYELNPQRGSKDHLLPAFRSKVNRFEKDQQKSPPVGLYELSQFTLNKGITKKQEVSQKNEEAKQQNERHKVIEKAIKSIIKIDKNKDVLGPGSYNPTLMESKKTFKISQNMYDRFGQLKPIYLMAKSIQAENGQKFLHEKVEQNRNMKMHSSFKSTTKKWEIELGNQMDPAKYNSNKSPTRVSHLINFSRKWL